MHAAKKVHAQRFSVVNFNMLIYSAKLLSDSVHGYSANVTNNVHAQRFLDFFSAMVVLMMLILGAGID